MAGKNAPSLLHRAASRPIRFALLLLMIWTLAGSLALMVGRSLGADLPVLWSLATTFLLTYSTAAAVSGIVAPHWLRHLGWTFVGYLLLAFALGLAVQAMGGDSRDELRDYGGMYAAFFFGFFFIHAVGGAVRGIASFLGLDKA
jgi:hypothetical protein